MKTVSFRPSINQKIVKEQELATYLFLLLKNNRYFNKDLAKGKTLLTNER